MGGIVGIWDFNDLVDKEELKKARDILKHRGPDDKGIFIDGNLGLGHRRLSILDLSKAGHQPMCNEDETVWITYNGEIYNFEEIKKDLEEKGHKFNSNTDTEVIIHAYEEYGHNCLELFNGMFAFAIWDSNKKEIFMARDRIGQKPLIYYFDGTKFIFASELKAILEFSGIKKEVNDESVSYYFSLGYVPSPLSILKNIYKLKPGNYAILTKDKFETKTYWQINLNNTNNKTEKEYCKEIVKNLTESTKKRMVSNVSLGAFLSGGLDSSAVVAIMSRLSSQPVKTFSIGFEEQEFDETKYARQISEKFGTDHKEEIVKMEALKIVDRLVWHYNEPFSDPASIPNFYLSQMAGKHVKAALSGDAGDHIFFGFERHKRDKYGIIPNHLPNKVNKFIGKTGRIFFSQGHDIPLFQKIGRKLDSIMLKEDEKYFEWIAPFNSYYKNKIITEQLRKFNSKKLIIDKMSTYSKIPLKKQFFDLTHSLPDGILNKVDISSMANGLEVRMPFLENKFFEDSIRIPFNLKIKNQINKYIFKKSFKDILPSNIVYRKKKGFRVPLSYWFRKELKNLAYDTLLSKECISKKYFNQKYFKKLLEFHSRGADHSPKIWNLIFLEKWFKLFMD